MSKRARPDSRRPDASGKNSITGPGRKRARQGAQNIPNSMALNPVQARSRESAPLPEPTRAPEYANSVPREAKDAYSTCTHTHSRTTSHSIPPSQNLSPESGNVALDRKVTFHNANLDSGSRRNYTCESCISTRGGPKATKHPRILNPYDPNSHAYRQGSTPASRFEKYGPFSLMLLPGELRDAIYTIAINDALATHPGCPASPAPYRPLVLACASPCVRSESLATYASIGHFTVPFKHFETWCMLVGDIFMSRLKKLTLTFESRSDLMPSCDFTYLYRFRSLFNPCVAIKLVINYEGPKPSDALMSQILGRPFSSEDTEADTADKRMIGEHMTAFIAKAKSERLAGLFEGNVLSDVFLRFKGQLASVRTTQLLWLTYDDLKDAFGAQSEFRLTMNGSLWQCGPLARTMAPRTTRKQDCETKQIETEEMKFGYAVEQGTFGARVQAIGGFGGFGSFSSFGGGSSNFDGKRDFRTISTFTTFGASSFGSSTTRVTAFDTKWMNAMSGDTDGAEPTTTKEVEER